MTGACIVGCVISGGHTPDCGPTALECVCCCHVGGAWRPSCDLYRTGDGCGPHAPDDACKGCLPVPATRGLACGRCAGDLVNSLTVVERLVRHIRASIIPGPPPSDAPTIKLTKRPDPPAPGDLGAIDDADILYAALWAWTGAACGILGRTGPEPQPAWRTTGSHGDVVGLPPDSDGHEAGPYAEWLLGQVDFILDDPMAADILHPDTGFPALVHAVTCRWPMEDRRKRVRGVRCPACTQKTIVRTPPEYPGQDELWTCTDCGWSAVNDLEAAS